jgi:hypothetical protein
MARNCRSRMSVVTVSIGGRAIAETALMTPKRIGAPDLVASQLSARSRYIAIGTQFDLVR